jgi:hypothetical protein
MKKSIQTFDLSKLDSYSRYQSNVPILNQKQVGSCVAHSYTSAMLKCRDLQGLQFVGLCADFLYAQIDGDQDRGSDPAQANHAVCSNGICPLSDLPDNFVLWRNISATAKQHALRFRTIPQAIYQCANFAEMVTADKLGFAVTLTINVGNNFSPNSEGVVGYTPGYANHCVSGGEGFGRLSDGTPYYVFRNSWDVTWPGVSVSGLPAGCARCIQHHIDGQTGPEVYAIQYASDDKFDPDFIPGL